MRRYSFFSATTLGLLSMSAACAAATNLIGTSVTGSLRFVGPTNYFTPATATIADPQLEYSYQDGFSRITADFTNTRLTISEMPFVSGDATIERYNFSDTAFAGRVAVVVSNTFPVSPTTSLVDESLSVFLPDNYMTTAGSTTALTLALTLPGDATLNGTVDFNDFLVLQNNFGQPNTRFDQGNFNFDGQTDFNDFLLLQNNFGQSVTGARAVVTPDQLSAMSAFAEAVSVPEPAALGVLGLVAIGLRRRRATRTIGTPYSGRDVDEGCDDGTVVGSVVGSLPSRISFARTTRAKRRLVMPMWSPPWPRRVQAGS